MYLDAKNKEVIIKVDTDKKLTKRERQIYNRTLRVLKKYKEVEMFNKKTDIKSLF